MSAWSHGCSGVEGRRETSTARYPRSEELSRPMLDSFILALEAQAPEIDL